MYLIRALIIAVAYFASAELGLSLSFETPSVTTIWPPTGIALAALVIWGRKYWPAVFVGAFAANAVTDVTVGTAFGIAVGNTLEAVVGATLLRWADFRPTFERFKDVFLLVLAGFLSTAVSATIGVASLVAGEAVSANLLSVWRVWWLGDMGGDLVIAPVLMLVATLRQLERPPGRVPEAILLLVSASLMTTFIFITEFPFVYLVFPFLIWAAIRFYRPGAAFINLVIASIAITFTAEGEGPFMGYSQDDSLLLAQSFVGIAGITALLLAVAVTGRRRVENEMRHIAHTLQTGLLPERFPDIPSVGLATYFRPAGSGYVVGGDFYDVFALDDDEEAWAVVLGDVRGKGPEAASATALARYTIRAVAHSESSPRDVLYSLNDAILRQREGSQFCTVVYSLFRLKEGAGLQMTCVVGGHPLPLVLRADGSVEFVGTPGMLIGSFEHPTLTETSTDLEPGDSVFFYTDGLTEAFAPERIVSSTEISAALASCKGLPAQVIIERVRGLILDMDEGDPRDDIALLALRVETDAHALPPQAAQPGGVSKSSASSSPGFS